MSYMGDENLAEYVTTVRQGDAGPLSRQPRSAVPEADERANDYPLVRFFFALPSPLPVADGWAIGTEPGKGWPPDCPMALLTFWQERYEMDSLSFGHAATMRVLDRLGLGLDDGPDSGPKDEELGAGGPDEGDDAAHEGGSIAEADEVDPGPLLRTVTVVDAITRWDHVSEGPAGWDGEPQNLDPKDDPVVRAVALARQVSRAFRLVDGRHIELISYERLPLAVVLFHSEGRVDRQRLHIPARADWTTSGIMTLNHWNLPSEAADNTPSQTIDEASAHWMRALRSGTPAVRAREILMEARIAMRQLGEYGEAVVKVNTGSEVLIDAFLSAMLWEENFMDAHKPGAEACGELFAEGAIKTRIRTMMAPRLKGDWSSRNSPIVKWLAGPHALRHRVVHGGYEPTRQEASDAIKIVDEMNTFLFDRLAAQRNSYKRVSLILLGQDGLDARGLLRGQILEFIERTANTEVYHLDSWGEWHQRLVVAAAGSR